MSLSVRFYQPADRERWDAFCADARQATFLHTRRFLAYHGDRFADYSVLIEQDGELLGVMPAALHPSDPGLVVSHPGSTFGGIVHQGRLGGERMLAALDAVCVHFAREGSDRLLYKAVPAFYHRIPAQDDLYALFRLNAQRVRCDLSSTIDLANRQKTGVRRRRSLAKAEKAGLVISRGLALLPRLWDVLTDNLARKHGVQPVHSLAEIIHLAEALPGELACVCAVKDGVVVAGVLLFISPTTCHVQYIASSEAGYQCSALDLVFESCIADATVTGKRWFDFGISTESGGRLLNTNLYQFKTEFGGGGTTHEFYELKLRGRANGDQGL